MMVLVGWVVVVVIAEVHLMPGLAQLVPMVTEAGMDMKKLVGEQEQEVMGILETQQLIPLLVVPHIIPVLLGFLPPTVVVVVVVEIMQVVEMLVEEVVVLVLVQEPPPGTATTEPAATLPILLTEVVVVVVALAARALARAKVDPGMVVLAVTE